MPDETDDREETTNEEPKPTITIAEKTAGSSGLAEPTITIAEKDGGK